MAESPIATAPLRSIDALSTTVTFLLYFLAQCEASKAAPQAAIPPPRINKSVSIITVSKFSVIMIVWFQVKGLTPFSR